MVKMFSDLELPFVKEMPRSGDVYLEFDEMDQEVKDTIKEYLATSAYKATKELEKRVCNCILKYLLINGSPFPERATETAISERMGIPRSKLRKLLGLLQWEEIIEPVPVGATQPYVVKDIGKAFKQGYLYFTDIEALKLTRIVGHLGQQAYHPLPTILRAIHSTIPNEMSVYKTWEWMVEAIKPMVQVQSPLAGKEESGAVSSTSAVGTDRELVQKFIDASLGQRPLPMVHEVLFELDIPDDLTKEQFFKGMKVVAEKYVRLIMKLTDPLAQLVRDGGLTLGPIATEKSLNKEQILASNQDHIYMFGDLLLDTPITDPRRGYIGLQTQPITPQHVRLTANFVRAAARLARKAGGGKDLVRKAEKRADMLDDEAEKGYRSQELIRGIRDLKGADSAQEALELLARATEFSLRHEWSWFWLGLTLFDGQLYEEALGAFKRAGELADEPLQQAAPIVWQGHMFDLLDQREKALEMYRKANVDPFPGTMRHDQYGIAVDKDWVAERLRTPFSRVEWKEKFLR